MPRRLAAIVGVENYRSDAIAQVAHARADAEAMAAVLDAIGFDAGRQIVLLDGDATKTTFETRLADFIADLRPDDTFYFFFAGRVSLAGQRGFFLCHDTNVRDVRRTALPLEWLFNAVRDTGCERPVFFLDASGEEASIDQAMDGDPSHVISEEIDRLIAASNRGICFSSSNAFGESRHSASLQHGIWTYHLVRALAGEEPGALHGEIVTARSLQTYLSAAVPMTIRETFADGKTQTPIAFGAIADECVIADPRPLIAARAHDPAADEKALKRILMSSAKSMRVERLTGFIRKTHRVPDNVNAASQSFLAKLTLAELEADVNAVARASREGFGYNRRSVRVEASAGSGSVITPGFEYSISVALNPEDPAEAVWRRDVRNVQQDLWQSNAMDQVFAATFDTLEFEFKQPADIEEIIDRVEALGSKTVRVHYNDTDLSRCEIAIAGFDGRIEITRSALKIESPGATSPSKLFACFKRAQSLLAEMTGPMEGPPVLN